MAKYNLLEQHLWNFTSWKSDGKVKRAMHYFKANHVTDNLRPLNWNAMGNKLSH